MKIFKILKTTLLFIKLSLFTLACVHNDDYNPPISQLEQNLTPTTNITALKKLSSKKAILLKDDIIEGYVISSDNGGNIYKNLYIVSNDGKDGIQLSINQSNLYNLYPLGRKIYINLDSLVLVEQYNMATLGLMSSGKYPVDQITPGLLNKHIILSNDHKYSNDFEELIIKANTSGKPLNVNDIKNDIYLNTLVELNNVEFTDPGTTFVLKNSNTDNGINNIDTKTFSVRVSKYANFGNWKKPFGTGKLRGILTKYNKTYQLLLRDFNDIIFPETKSIFLETFNQTCINGNLISSSPWPKLKEISNFDNPNISVSDPFGTADIRKTSLFSLSLWLPKGKDASLVINNINTQKHKNLNLSFKLNANIFNNWDKAFTDDLIIKCNDREVSLPHTELNVSNNKNKYYTVNIKIPNNTSKLEFFGSSSKNKTGLRIDDIRIFN